MVSIIIGTLIGAAVGVVSLVIVALAHPRHPVARALALAVGPIAAGIVLLLSLFPFAPTELDVVVLVCSVLAGTAGYIAFDRRLGRKAQP